MARFRENPKFFNKTLAFYAQRPGPRRPTRLWKAGPDIRTAQALQPITAATMWYRIAASTAVAGTVITQAATMRSTTERLTISFL